MRQNSHKTCQCAAMFLTPMRFHMHRGAKHEAMGKEGRALGSRLATTPGRFAAECRGTDAKMISRTVQPGA